MTEAVSGKKLCWLVPDDKGGGVVSVALSCCREARAAGHDVTLLMLLAPTGHIQEHVDFNLASLDVLAPGFDAPKRMVEWLVQNPQDMLFLNGCEQADIAIPYIPIQTRCVYVVHDTAPRYWRPALRHEKQLDVIVAVSHTVANAFRRRLRSPEKLRVLHNGTLFPASVDTPGSVARTQDIIFLGGDSPIKGAYDVLMLWPKLIERGFTGLLHWFGRINQSFADEIAGLPRADAIILHGRVVRSQIFQRAASARVFLMLSRVEPFGMATIECMGMGTVPVAWDVMTGTKEIVQEGYPFFAPLGDYDNLADQVLEACADHPRLCGAAMRRAREHFSEGAMWHRYASLIDATLEQPPADRAKAGQHPPSFRPHIRLFQLLPKELRAAVRSSVGRSARLGYWLRNFRGV
jgi:glycosyltransferase involved in cell wall biosynthesis